MAASLAGTATASAQVHNAPAPSMAPSTCACGQGRRVGPRLGVSIFGSYGVGGSGRAGFQLAPALGLFVEVAVARTPAPEMLLLGSMVVLQWNPAPRWAIAFGGGAVGVAEYFPVRQFPQPSIPRVNSPFGLALVRGAYEVPLGDASRRLGALSFGVQVHMVVGGGAPYVLPLPTAVVGFESW